MDVKSDNSIYRSIDLVCTKIGEFTTVFNYHGIVLRALNGVADTFMKVPDLAQASVGGTRIIKFVAIPIYIFKTGEYIHRLTSGKSKEKLIDVINAINYGANTVEGVGLAIIGLNAIKLLAIKVMFVATQLAFAGLMVQLVTVISDVYKIVQGEEHLKRLDAAQIKKMPSYLFEKTEEELGSEEKDPLLRKACRRFKDIYSISKEKYKQLAQSIDLDQSQFFDHFRKRVRINQLNRGINLAINLIFAAAVLILTFTPLAPLAWSIIGVCAVILIVQFFVNLKIKSDLDKELEQLVPKSV